MRTLSLSFVLLGACGGSGGQPVGYTLRFDTLTTTVPSDNDQIPARVFPFGDGFVAFTSEISLTNGAGGWTKVRPLDHALGGAVLGDQIVALVDGGVAVSTDGLTYTPVSERALTGLTAVGDTLIGVEVIDSFSAQVVRSTDGGATWTPSGLVYTETLIEIGSLTGLCVGSGPDVAWVRFIADADLGDNVDFLTELWQVDATGTGTLVGEDFLAPAPTAQSADGITLVDLGAAADSLNAPTNRLSVAWSDGYEADRAVEDYTRIHLVSEVEPGGPVLAGLLGVDDAGHALVTAHGRVMRSTTPVGRDGDMSQDVWQGPGCDDWVDRAVTDDDQP